MGKQSELVDYWRQRAITAEARVALLMGMLSVKAPDLVEANAVRRLDPDEEAEALRGFRPLP